MKMTMKTRINYSAVIALTLIMASCATPYQSVGFVGGYSDTALAPDVYHISFRGNGYTSSERAQDFALLHAADMTLSHGFRYFAIVNGANSTSVSSITLPGQAYTSMSVTGYGNSAYGTAVTTVDPPTSIPIFKPSSGLLIRCFAARPERGYVFDARFLSNSIRAKYHMTADLVKDRAALSRSAPPLS
jgi:hypothetical protein